ncbi:GntR family transcriptional regulator/MocR family aminotransferase [Undibacterium sp. GrIS 1.2]|uniref:MocR-like pyridoxine biosynthesis transcription factor PdxR n=1 Tax=Undibacterium sp. GrIS 1.2 TaxID=3143933 RepID=UPI0033970361
MDYALLIANFSKEHHDLNWSRQRLLHECLRTAIRNGNLSAGMRLPSTRQLAADMGLARNTALYAYEQLATEGYVRSDRRGTVVADIGVATSQTTKAATYTYSRLSRRAKISSPIPGSNMSCAFAPGVPSLADFPIGTWRRLLDRAWRSIISAQLNYADVAGDLQLRKAIADHLRVSRGAACDATQIFITDGTQASLDLCARAFADAGDLVWIENPGYKGALVAFRAAELRLHAISIDSDGIAPSAADWVDHPPKLIYVTPSHQYPTGSVLSVGRRIALIDSAKAAGALIIEDDYDSEFRHDGPPLSAMQGLTHNAPVIYLGTFSKTMFPALRIGFMVVPTSMVETLTQLLEQSIPRGRVADQLALAEFLLSGQFAMHLRRMRRLYRQRRNTLCIALETHVGSIGRVYGESAGMHLILYLDNSVSDVLVSSHALQKGIVAQPMSVHAVEEGTTRCNGLILGYAQLQPSQIVAAVKELAAIIQKVRKCDDTD